MENIFSSYYPKIDFCDVTQTANIAIIQLKGSEPRFPDVVPFSIAHQQGLVVVKELSEAGSVGELTTQNLSQRYILLLEGEILIGAKQNRTLNATVLLAPHSTTIIPVSCIERGRWDYMHRDFRPFDAFLSPEIRAIKTDSVTANYLRSKALRSDQGLVWHKVSSRLEELRVSSPTESFDSAYRTHETNIDASLKKIGKHPECTGVLGIIQSRIVGYDIIPHPATFAHYFEQIVRSYILDSLHLNVQPQESTEALLVMARKFLEQVKESRFIESPSIGVGTEARVSASSIVGTSLIFKDTLIHSTAFSLSRQMMEY